MTSSDEYFHRNIYFPLVVILNLKLPHTLFIIFALSFSNESNI